MRLRNWRIVPELLLVIAWLPVRRLLRQVCQGICLIVTAPRQLVVWPIRRLWRSSRWYRCDDCERWCHADFTPATYWQERRDGVLVIEGQCHGCSDAKKKLKRLEAERCVDLRRCPR